MSFQWLSWLRETSEKTIILICVRPRAEHTGSIGQHNGEIKIRVATPGLEGNADGASLRFVAERAGLTTAKARTV